MVTDSYGAAASGEVLDLHLLGRHVSFGTASVTSALDSLAPKLDAEAKGIATLLVPASTAVARFGDSAPAEACAVPQVQQLTGLLGGEGLQLPVVDGLGGLGLGGLLPKLEINVGCATASVAGSPADFVAESVGGILHVSVALPEAIQGLIGTVRSQVNGLLSNVPGNGNLTGLPIADLVPIGDAASALAPVEGLLSGLGVPLVGGAAGGVTDVLSLNALAPVLNPTQTVDNLLAGLENGDLLRIDLGVATAQNSGSVEKYLSQAVSNGGVIEVLPNFGGVDKPLLRISIAKSTATVVVDRAGAVPSGSADNTIVRIESPLLPDLNLASLPIVGPLLGSTGLPVVDSVVPVVQGLLGGVPTADGVLGGLLGFDATVKGLGLKSGPGYIELSPGMSVSILCDGLVTPLCTEISVGAVKAPEMLPDGRMRVESSAATIHLFKNLDTLGLTGLPVLGDLKLGTILGNDLLGGLLAPVTGAAGLNVGEPSDVPGIRLSLAHAVAEAGGTKVMGAIQEQARDLAPVATSPAEIPSLPRTGGLPVDATAIPVLLGASAGLRALVRRRRNA
ncbi:MAG: hypothetical protein M3357_00590 [Actinomycetota bacterium]|nr:hypothetical protein [Actinomycetota bacterium]